MSDPNVLIIMTDQQQATSLGLYVNAAPGTPAPTRTPVLPVQHRIGVDGG